MQWLERELVVFPIPLQEKIWKFAKKRNWCHNTINFLDREETFLNQVRIERKQLSQNEILPCQESLFPLNFASLQELPFSGRVITKIPPTDHPSTDKFSEISEPQLDSLTDTLERTTLFCELGKIQITPLEIEKRKKIFKKRVEEIGKELPTLQEYLKRSKDDLAKIAS